MAARKALATLVLIAAVFGSLAAPSAGAATPGEVTSFPVPEACSESRIATAPTEGALVRTCDGALYNLLPSGELVKLPSVGSREAPMLSGPAGEVWTAEGYVGGPYSPTRFPARAPTVDRLAPDGSVERFPIASEERGEETAVRGLTLGADGTLWVAIGEMTPIGGPPWETSLGGELVRIATDGTESNFPLPEQIEPKALAVGSDGNVWFTAVRGYATGEHGSVSGVGYIGRVTPQGAFKMFRDPPHLSTPSAIAAAPDGALRFIASGVQTISTEGRFGQGPARGRTAGSSIAVGPEGDTWLGGYLGVDRLTPSGQQTTYPGEAGGSEGVAAGPEGDIWALADDEVQRIVPGGPGIDAWKAEADRGSSSVRVLLACGGSVGCEGKLRLELLAGAEGKAKKPLVSLGSASYSLGAESHGPVTIKVPVKALALARRHRPPHAKPSYRPLVAVDATVAGGPTLQTRIRVPGLG